MKKVKPHTVDWAQIERFLTSADKKLASAHKILAFDEEACLQQAYEAMLKASRGFMFSHGFRARSQPGHHIAIIDFVRSRLDKKHAGLLIVMPSSFTPPHDCVTQGDNSGYFRADEIVQQRETLLSVQGECH
jgi:hypothetical protein